MQHTDARDVVKNTIRYCEDILQSKKRFTQNFQNELRNNLIYCFKEEREGEECFIIFYNREYKDLGGECGYPYTWGQPTKCGPYATTRYWIAGPLPEHWCPLESPSGIAGYLYCDGYQPYYDRKNMKNYVDCLYELLDLLNSL